MAAKCRFFAVRPAGEVVEPSGQVEYQQEAIVPLIPLDELPSWIEIKGIPRYLGLRDTAMMTNVGDLPSVRAHLDILLASAGPSNEAGFKTPLPLTDKDSPPPTEYDSIPSAKDIKEDDEPQDTPKQLPTPMSVQNERGRSFSKTRSEPGRHHADDVSASSDEVQPLQPRTSRESSSNFDDSGDEGPKYCQRYCHHGPGPKGCQKGADCPSIHELPLTREGLRSVGLERIPYWHPDSSQLPPHQRQPRTNDMWRSQGARYYQMPYRKRTNDRYPERDERRVQGMRSPTRSFKARAHEGWHGQARRSDRERDNRYERDGNRGQRSLDERIAPRSRGSTPPISRKPKSYEECVRAASPIEGRSQSGRPSSVKGDAASSRGRGGDLIDMS